jgi:DNA-binding NarL/FixJ family response regulator
LRPYKSTAKGATLAYPAKGTIERRPVQVFKKRVQPTEHEDAGTISDGDGPVQADAEAWALDQLPSIVVESIRSLIPEIADGVVTALEASERAGGSRWTQPESPVHLSPREKQVLLLVGKGLTNASVARHLNLSTRTVETHVNNAMNKLDAPSGKSAATRAVQMGIINLNDPDPPPYDPGR